MDRLALRSLSQLYEKPWPPLTLDKCRFYHSMQLPGERVEGEWEIRDFPAYIGGVDVRSKTVLDVGTATGFLAFSAEREGAAQVTALDIRSHADTQRVPFSGHPYHLNRRAWSQAEADGLQWAKNGFWYCWHKLGSQVRVAYTGLDALHDIDDRFDVVMAGALIEHLSDPVSALGLFARLAREQVVIAYTPIAEGLGKYMIPAEDWRADHSYTWWKLSRDLYVSVFAGLGFSVRFAPSVAYWHGTDRVERLTLIATRATAATTVSSSGLSASAARP